MKLIIMEMLRQLIQNPLLIRTPNTPKFQGGKWIDTPHKKKFCDSLSLQPSANGGAHFLRFR